MNTGILNRYMNLSLSEIKNKIKENDKILNKIWDEDDGNSWNKYCEKCQSYWDDNKLLYAAESLKLQPEEIEMKKFTDLDKECLMPIEEFIACCKSGFITSYDGCGYYATKNEVSNLNASPWAFKNGFIRKDFTHVCWFNK